MTDDLDRALRGTLATAAGEAPDVGPGLLERVEAEHRGRRRRRTSAAALAVAILLGGTGAVGVVSRPDQSAPGITSRGKPTKVSLSDLGTPVNMRERWPAAVHDVPRELPNGQALHPIAMVSLTTLVGATSSSFEAADKLWAYYLEAQQATVITEIVTPPGSDTYASDFTIRRDHIVWWLTHRTDRGMTLELWTAPVTGGEARKVTAMPGSSLSTLLIDGEDIVWSMKDGVYRVPLSGGSPRKIPGTEGLQIVSWPWIGSPAARDQPGIVQFRTLRNVRTGELREVTFAPFRPFKGTWSCAVTWCVGGPAKDVVHGHPDVAMVVQRRDGKAGRALPPGMLPMRQEVLYDRFLFYSPSGLRADNFILYDLQTNKLLDTGIRRTESYGPPSFARDDRDPTIFIETEDGTSFIDLSAIR